MALPEIGAQTDFLNDVCNICLVSKQGVGQMWEAHIQVLAANAELLKKGRRLKPDEFDHIKRCLDEVRGMYKNECFCFTDFGVFSDIKEKINKNIGTSLTEVLYLGRDTDRDISIELRLWLRDSLSKLQSLLINIMEIMVDRAEDEISIFFPAFAHLQKIQPIRWSQWLLQYVWYLSQDLERLRGFLKRMDRISIPSPLNLFNFHPENIAKELNFSNIYSNALTGGRDRDFLAEYTFFATMVSIHLSQIAEDLIIYSTEEFSYVKLGEAYITDSHSNPFKFNPTGLEEIRSGTGQTTCNFIGMLSMLKDRSTYISNNGKCEQLLVFDMHSAIFRNLCMFFVIISQVRVNEDKCLSALHSSMCHNAISNWLIKKGYSINSTLDILTKIEDLAKKKNQSVLNLPLESLEEICKDLSSELLTHLTIEENVEQEQGVAGTSMDGIKRQIIFLRELMKESNKEKDEKENLL